MAIAEWRSELYQEIGPAQWPIVYRPEYNVRFLGLQKLHPFDAEKWGNVFQLLKRAELVNDETVTTPNEATRLDLLVVHSSEYLRSLQCSLNVARIAEVPLLAAVPNCLVQRWFLRPMRFQTGGSVLAGRLALDRGWAINIGGGFHHCSADRGGGFCSYADISLLVRFLLRFEAARVRRVMILDLDAHQGNGHERDFMDDRHVYIMDMYNGGVYPQDVHAKAAIRRRIELDHMTGDKKYLALLDKHLDAALAEFQPDIIVYNAGTDVLEGDPLGRLAVSTDGIVRRDQKVFERARQLHVPIVMLTSGGYQRRTASVIATSILNLRDEGLIEGPPRPPSK